ncbi:hypothetical protein [Escherichia coli]|uniref:hypothetical protein n=1 Tax=Escherichia coli TaxID=562 RepID=UPI003DA7BE3E
MTTDITELAQRTDLLMDNALETAKQLRELSESPVAEAIFESIVENENGKEIQFERPISDLAYTAFLKLERLVEALEKAHAKADVYDMLRDDYGLRDKGVGLADFVDWQAKRIAELEEAERKLCAANVTLDARAEQAERERENWRTSFDNEQFRADKLKAHIDDIEPIRAAAEKLVRCKGRYHSELNYRALAALFGVTSPDLPPLDSESCTVTVKPDDADEVREEGNQFLVVRHPGKVPVIKHPVGQLEDYLLQILKADPLATIDIVTHRYYGVGGQFVEDADEYLHEMGIKWEAE